MKPCRTPQKAQAKIQKLKREIIVHCTIDTINYFLQNLNIQCQWQKLKIQTGHVTQIFIDLVHVYLHDSLPWLALSSYLISW